MIDAIVEQVENAVDCFVAKNPSLRNDRDDLVQDVFLKVLPRINGNKFNLSQCRAFTHQATFWVCQTALRRTSNKKRKKNINFYSAGVQYMERDIKRKDTSGMRLAEVMNGSFITCDPPIDWDRIEQSAKDNDALLTWFEIEKNSDVSEELREQIRKKFEFLIE